MTTSKNILSDEQGFSLVETLVAVFLLSVVSMITLGIMTNFADANRVLSSKMGAMEEIDQTRDYLRVDLRETLNRGFFVAESGKETNKLLMRLTRGNNELSKVDDSVSPVETIEYWLNDETLVRRVYDRPEATVDTPYREYTLLDDINDFSIRFYNGNLWQSYWMNAESSQVTALPKAVEFSWLLNGQIDHNQNRMKTRFQVGASS
ncbi:type II secretion system protein GspJ [Pseudemcibacter aquimaris]|uniref:type II secretion system protein GspJ n=1 Tax=Pseudemcibacter aquimaris TaxID=2857064 RepID=UPI002010F38D|nr:type II secretion system protein GspJ [Pseudemcibacter aquimaris]MCC3861757.1 prepilin-type N-terminal cleavage/methylation domain-containing protein [Pseudemcibacter aquimaris]WDU60268.1 prepilin-type N-terminal cleavage/methylation domain-containing protein [Pseudemcibacter aquimaris]